MSRPETWSIARFETERPELCQFLRGGPIPALERGCPRILIRAPVKSGKRQMVEYIAQRDAATVPRRIHGFVSAWHRAADQDQRNELETYRIRVWSGLDKKMIDACNKWVSDEIAKGRLVVLHLDECDHGSGVRQLLGKLWRTWQANEHVLFVLYSATPEEVLFSREVDDDDHDAMLQELITGGIRFNYTPPAGFCGPERFLQEGLVHEAKPFFGKVGEAYALSPQGSEIVTNMKRSMGRRNILILRLSYSDGERTTNKNNKAIYQFLEHMHTFPELADFLVFADKGEGDMKHYTRVIVEKVQWSNADWWDSKTTERPILIVCDQTSSRSTEWACHNRIYATHDYRNQITFSVVSQAQERTNHYAARYGGFQPILVYGHTKTFQLSAAKIDYETYLTHEWESRKLDKRTTADADLYVIRKTSDKTPHPDHPHPVGERKASQILQSLGCSAEISLSARVKGNIFPKRIYKSTFFPTSKETWDTDWAAFCAVPENHVEKNHRNPFLESEKQGLEDGQWKGQHRGWRVIDYAADIEDSTDMGSTGGDRLAICYRNGVLGVAFVKCTGTDMVNSLTAYKSMYAPRVH